jgi:glycine/D-amino acid oxidase-like deaminating enzyme/nitrite reductase/ring-hydroxylating ferredoxin subunit
MHTVESVWIATHPIPRRPPLDRDEAADVCVVGAGIAGMTAAYLLAREGRRVVVVDDGTIGGGMTSRTTAHLQSAVDDRFHVLERTHGNEGARLIYESHAAAIDAIERIVADERIACEFRRLPGYLFAPPGDTSDEIEREYDAATRAGFADVEIVSRAPIPGLDSGRALRFPRQAQFHPLRYLDGLARAFERLGGRVACGSHAQEIEGGSTAYVRMRDGPVVFATSIVVTTNVTINDRLVLHTKQAPYMTYVVALELRGAIEPALFWDTRQHAEERGDGKAPYHYVRMAELGPLGDVLLVGGEDHKTGQAQDAEARYARLAEWARDRWPIVGAVRYRWSGQVMEPNDGLAYIGRNPADDDNVYVCTGDSGNGMTHGTIAGLLITDLIAGRANPWSSLYDPSRIKLRSAGEFAKENLNVAKQYVTGYASAGDVSDETEIVPGSGAILRRGLSKVAAYRDERGRLHEHSAVCTHLGCIVQWNASERTWDCPCHGSRFSCEGKVINGPANRDLEVAIQTVE